MKKLFTQYLGFLLLIAFSASLFGQIQEVTVGVPGMT